MYVFIGKLGQLYKLNANCPANEKHGIGPGSCGGKKKLTLEEMLGKAKLPTKERSVSSSYIQQSNRDNTIKEAAKIGISVELPFDANFDEVSITNRLISNLSWYRDSFPSFRTNKIIFQDLGRSYARSNTNDGIIRISRKHARNMKETKKLLQQDVSSKFHPVGCDTIQSVVDHEIGHQLDKQFGITTSKEFIQIIGGMNYSQVVDGLSRYAADNINEIVSEAWSEFKNNPNPRPIASAIGNLIMKHVKVH